MKRNVVIICSLALLFNTNVQAADITHQSFDDVEFNTTRLTSNDTNYAKIPTELANAYGSLNYKNLKLDRQIAEMVRLRVGQIDQCDYCVVFHTNDLLETGVPQVKVNALSTWRDSALFSDKEKAALAYAEALSSVNNGAIQAAFDQLKVVGFSDAEKEDLTMCTVLMNLWSRLFLAQGKTSAFKTAAASK